GAAAEIVSRYRRTSGLGALETPPDVDSPVKTTAIEFLSGSDVGATGYPLRTIVAFSARRTIPDAIVEVSYSTHGGEVLVCQQTTALSGPRLTLDRGDGAIEFATDELGLQPGCYDVSCRIATAAGETLHTFVRPERLFVDSGRMISGYFYMPHSWRKTLAADRSSSRVPAVVGVTGIEEEQTS